MQTYLVVKLSPTERAVINAVRPFIRIGVDDEPPSTTGVRLRDRNEIEERLALLNTITEHKGEPLTHSRLLKTYQMLSVLRERVARETQQRYWPEPQNDTERGIRDVLIEARQSQLVLITAAVDIVLTASGLCTVPSPELDQ